MEQLNQFLVYSVLCYTCTVRCMSFCAFLKTEFYYILYCGVLIIIIIIIIIIIFIEGAQLAKAVFSGALMH